MNRIPEVLKEKGMKQSQLAVALGLSRSCISQYCSGKVDVPISKLMAISVALDCDITELLVPTKKKNK
ncbi:MAG: helix-turn-helix transcriptional regulator [Bacteroidia bacterium]|nr:helix-turn-helix transcriptional regulator [Bacteroidia bacterium]